MRHITLAVLLFLCGCGTIQEQEQKAHVANLEAQSSAAHKECNAQYPAGIPKIAVARAHCINNAISILRPLAPFPDLLDTFYASRVAIAERVQNNQITVAQANEAVTQKRSELIAEQDRRLLARRSVAAQESGSDQAERAVILQHLLRR